MPVFFGLGPPSRFGGLGFVGAELCRAARFAPLPVVLVPPEHFLQDGIDDVVGVALDEPGIVFEQFVDGLFESYFPSHDPWCFLNERHTVPPLVMCVSSELPVTVEKTAARFTVPQGGSDPMNFLGG